MQQNIIDKMASLRKAAGYSQRKISSITGIAQTTIARIEAEQTSPNINTVLDILRALGYTLQIVPLDSTEKKEVNNYD